MWSLVGVMATDKPRFRIKSHFWHLNKCPPPHHETKTMSPLERGDGRISTFFWYYHDN
jgi:hypothetical protein